MKRVTMIIILLAFVAGASAQNTGKETNPRKGMGDKYVPGYSRDACTCAVSEKEGKLTVLQNGAPVKGDVQIAPSVRITSDGRLKKADGAERMLSDGNCVSEKGTITIKVP